MPQRVRLHGVVRNQSATTVPSDARVIEAAACHVGAAREGPSEDCESASSTVMVHCAVCVSCVGLLPAGLYLPTNWYHYVRSEGRNIGVNFWYYLNPDFEGDCAESFDEPERLSLANCSWLGPGWDWQWNHETGITPTSPASFPPLLPVPPEYCSSPIAPRCRSFPSIVSTHELPFPVLLDSLPFFCVPCSRDGVQRMRRGGLPRKGEHANTARPVHERGGA